MLRAGVRMMTLKKAQRERVCVGLREKVHVKHWKDGGYAVLELKPACMVNWDGDMREGQM